MDEAIRYEAPGVGVVPERQLVALAGTDAGRRFVFYDFLEIGRYKPSARMFPGRLFISDPTISSRHCVVTQDAYGRCAVRDLSLNGTWIEGRRLVPGAESEFRIGEILSVGGGHEFRLEGDVSEESAVSGRATVPVSAPTEVTVLMGDIVHYTAMVRRAPMERLQRSMGALFQRLERMVNDRGGTVKEYPGDALLAYWEADESRNCAVRACAAALELNAEADRMATDPAVWTVPDCPLRMEWALATGLVTIGRVGQERARGLSVVGEPIVKAYRLEKVADETTGPILACSRTRSLAKGACAFRSLGTRELDGFAAPEEIHALVGAP